VRGGVDSPVKSLLGVIFIIILRESLKAASHRVNGWWGQVAGEGKQGVMPSIVWLATTRTFGGRAAEGGALELDARS
jgi:hypothetical protein